MKVVKSLDIVNDYIEKLEQENKQLKQDLKRVNEILCNDNLCHIEKLQEIYKILGDKENE